MMSKRSNGEGTIYKRANGTWCASYYMNTLSGKKRKSLYGKTQKEVREKLKKALQENDGKISTDREDMKFETWMLIWLDEYKKNNLKITTYENYRINIEKHICGSNIGKTALNKLTTQSLQMFYNSKFKGEEKEEPLSARTVHYLHTIINGAMKQAQKEHLIKENVNVNVELPKKERQEMKVMKVEDMRKLLEVAKDGEYYVLIMLELQTGLRKGEILGLQWDDIDLEKKELTIRHNLCRITDDNGKAKYVLLEPKTASSKRTLPLNEGMVSLLQSHKSQQVERIEKLGSIYADPNIVFADESGNFISPRKLLQEFHNLLERAEIQKCRFHDLRHSFASLLLQKGESVKVIHELLGHSMISTTLDIYTHTSEEIKRKGIANIAGLLEDE